MSTFDPGVFDVLFLVDSSETGSYSVSASLRATLIGSLTISATLGQTAVSGLPVAAVVYGEQSGSKSIDAVLAVPDFGLSLSVDAFLSGFFNLSAFVNRDYVWTTPPDGEGIDQRETFAFLMRPPMAGPMHFEINLDKVATFDGPDLIVVKSHLDQMGWEYWNGEWMTVPQSGVPEMFAGNEARYTMQVSLSAGTWFRRVRTGVI